MLTSFHTECLSVLDKLKFGTNENVVKPSCIVDFGSRMGGVDLSDQLNQYNSVARKSKKWWRKLFFHLMHGVEAWDFRRLKTTQIVNQKEY
ncbi:hypothetical protein DPMN_027386 [Dreissena polymorpha]|uniref:PiggyBac transposable element-derived protein domain-containing protein n=1 Tax=Dreissena polymorpha TaxID=45954 RepID=A0A9D4LV47_DREPO|nr:hypothetical protein DPMN_027386 [Dreissena polymorpha]